MSITDTGKGLNILIICEYVSHHDWMTFASWYSIYKNLPDAVVKIACARTGNLQKSIFNWVAKCNVQFVQYSIKNVSNKELASDLGFYSVNQDFISITPEVMAVSYYNELGLGPITAKSDSNSTFVNYSEGCGKFVLSEWINTWKNPFGSTDKLYSDKLLLNEYRILKCWEKCQLTYSVIG